MTKETEITLQVHYNAPAVPGFRTPPRLISQWYKDAEGRLVMRWVVELGVDEHRLLDALAA